MFLSHVSTLIHDIDIAILVRHIPLFYRNDLNNVLS